MTAKGTYSVKKWEEKPYEEISSDMKMTKASVEYAMTGDLNGKAVVEYLMFYEYFDANDQHKSNAVYVGLMRFVGTVQDKDGSFAMEDHGGFENGVASSTLQIIAGSGTGGLKGIHGTGHYSAGKDGIKIELDYAL